MCGCRQLHGVLAVGSGEYVEIEPHTVMLRTDYLRGLLTVGAGKLAVTVPADALLLPAGGFDWTTTFRTAILTEWPVGLAKLVSTMIARERRQEYGFMNMALAEWVRDGAVLDAEICDG